MHHDIDARVLTAGGIALLTAVTALAQFGGPRGSFREYPNTHSHMAVLE